MDIDAIVDKITARVLEKVQSHSSEAHKGGSQAAKKWDNLPPAGPSSSSRLLPSAHNTPSSKKQCYKMLTGECGGQGSCAELIPEDVRAIVDCGAERIGNTLGGRAPDKELAARIDHTLLKPDTTQEQVVELCQEARDNGFCSVCVNPNFVNLAASLLQGSSVKVCTVIGFPLGATTSHTKAAETRDAVANGADEIDMVINIGALKNIQDDVVFEDIRQVVLAAGGRIVKTILETALLSDDEVVRASLLAKKAGADFVKTSTGFGPGGATVHHVELMRKTVGPLMGVKASGGVRDLETAQSMLKAGATRIGASASVKIVRGESGGSGY